MASTPKIALNVISRNEEKNIARCISSVLPNVDAVYILDSGSTDKTVEIAKSLGANVIEVGNKFDYITTKVDEKWVKDYLGPLTKLTAGDKLFRFAEARNSLLSQTPKEYEWILWIDADDYFRGKENLRQMVDIAIQQSASMVFLKYRYYNEFNPDGSIKNTLIEHLRERLFKNDGTYRWVADIHETLIQQKQDKKINLELADVVHTTQFDDMNTSIDRNIKNLENEVRVSKAEDPRPIYYLSKAYYDLRDQRYLPEVLRLNKAYRNGSGWSEERAQSWEYDSWVWQKLGNYNNAIKTSMNSFIENPQSPSNFITLAQNHLLKGEFDKALFWVKLSAHVEQPMTTLVMNPRDLIFKSLEVIYQASLRTNQLDEAWSAMYKIVEMFPEEENVKREWQSVNQMKQDKDLTIKAIDIARYLFETNQKEKIKQLISALPSSVADNQLITQMAQNIFPPRKHNENEISIFCGPGFEVWNPITIEKQGSGGSEEAVYRLSRELSRLGYKVSVYAEPGDQRGIHDGVDYRNFYEMNWKDEFNILISWRRADAMDMEINAKKHYIWLHDLPNPREFTPKRLENVDKVIVLSKYHASLLEPFTQEGQRYGVMAEKIFVSSNGVSV